MEQTTSNSNIVSDFSSACIHGLVLMGDLSLHSLSCESIFLSHLIPSCPILSYPILAYPVLSHPIPPNPIMYLAGLPCSFDCRVFMQTVCNVATIYSGWLLSKSAGSSRFVFTCSLMLSCHWVWSLVQCLQVSLLFLSIDGKHGRVLSVGGWADDSQSIQQTPLLYWCNHSAPVRQLNQFSKGTFCPGHNKHGVMSTNTLCHDNKWGAVSTSGVSWQQKGCHVNKWGTLTTNSVPWQVQCNCSLCAISRSSMCLANDYV